MSSPRLGDEELAKVYGRRDLPKGAIPFDQPQELGYCCPEGHTGDYLEWSEFKEHIWCGKCQKDYHYALDCTFKRMCWMNKQQWQDFIASLPTTPIVLRGVQPFPDCAVPHRKPESIKQ